MYQNYKKVQKVTYMTDFFLVRMITLRTITWASLNFTKLRGLIPKYHINHINITYIYRKSVFQIEQLKLSLDRSFPNHSAPFGGFSQHLRQNGGLLMNLIDLNRLQL